MIQIRLKGKIDGQTYSFTTCEVDQQEEHSHGQSRPWLLIGYHDVTITAENE